MKERQEPFMEQQVKIAKQILTKLGDFSTMSPDEDLQQNISTTAEILLSVGDLDDFPEEISDLFVQCFSQLTVQIPILATLLSLLHINKPVFSQLVVWKVGVRLLQALGDDDVSTAKLLSKTIACLSASGSFLIGSPSPDGGIGLSWLMEQLIGVVDAELSSGSSLPPPGQIAAYLLSTLCVWAAGELRSTGNQAVLQSALDVLTRLLSGWSSPFAEGGLQAVFNLSTIDPDVLLPGISEGPPESRCWDSLWEACHVAVGVLEAVPTQGAEGSSVDSPLPSCMLPVWVTLMKDHSIEDTAKLSFDVSFATQLGDLFNGRIVGSHATHCLPGGGSWLRARFAVFDIESSDHARSCCQLSSLDKFIAVDYFADIVHFFDPIINDDGTKLGSIDLMAQHLLAVSKHFSVDAHLEYALVEMLFQLLLQQPNSNSSSSMLSALICRLMLELCKKDPVGYPPVVAFAANTVFQLVPEVDYLSGMEFGKWFAFHLLNTNLSWPYWDFWASELEDSLQESSLSSLVELFIKYILDKCFQASVPDKLKAVFPAPWHSLNPALNGIVIPARCPLFPPENPLLDETPPYSSILANYLLTEEDRVDLMAAAAQLKTMLDKKANPDDVTEWLDGLQLQVTAESEPLICWRGCLLVQTLLYKGSSDTALSAMIGLLDRYSETIRTAAITEESQLDILAMLTEVFSSDSYMYRLVLNEMLRRGQLSVLVAAKGLTLTSCEPYTSDHLSFSIAQLHVHPAVVQCIEGVMDRTLDFVNAAIAERAHLGGDMLFDETADLTPGQPMEVSTHVPHEHPVQRVDVDDDEDDDTFAQRKRARRENDDDEGVKVDSVGMEGMDINQATEAEDPIWLADEAVKSALRNSRGVYALFLKGFAEGIHRLGAEASWSLIARSLLRRLLRVFHGTEKHLSHLYKQRVLISLPRGEIEEYLKQLPFSTGQWIAQLQ